MSEGAVCVGAPAARWGEGDSVRFSITLHGVSRDGFAVCWHGEVRAFVNSCRHQSRQLDFGDGHFFDEAFDALVCCHHGARFHPQTGECVEGPCKGAFLTALTLVERDGALWASPSAYSGSG